MIQKTDTLCVCLFLSPRLRRGIFYALLPFDGFERHFVRGPRSGGSRAEMLYAEVQHPEFFLQR